MIIEIPKSEHSILGPSSAKRWINCPGSVLATKDLPEQTSSFAAEGTTAHHVADLCADENVSAAKYLGQEFKSEGYTFTCDDEMVEAVDEFLEYVADYDGVHVSETRVSQEEWVPGGFGRCDRAVIAETCHVFDFKYGKGVQVFAKNNEQGMEYALGILHDFGWLCPFKEFVIHICQPRLDHWDNWSISVDDLKKWAGQVLKPAARKTLDPNAPFKAGEWCQFCKIKATCKVRAETIMQVVDPGSGFDDLDAPTPRNIPTLTREQIEYALKQRINAKKWFGDLAAYAMAEIKAGRPIGEWKIVEGGSKRRFKKEVPGLVSKLKGHGLLDTDIWESKIRSPAQIEKKLKKEKKVIADYVEKPPGKPTLADGNDPREAMSTDALNGFTDLETEEGD